MKLQCQVEVTNRNHSNLNIRSKGNYLKSTLALAKEPKAEAGYCIIHFSSTNKTGVKYNINNLKKVFSKYHKEGKTTLRFDEPPHDLCIKSEAIQLTCFMKLLKSCLCGDEKKTQITSLSNIIVTHKDHAPTKLVIHSRKDFPIKGFPRTLESLYINGINLCNFRRDILLLKQLTVLDLSNNEIEKLPHEFGRMPNLCELYLSNNQIGVKGEVDWRWLLGPEITKKLKLLDISGNKLGHLPNSIWKLQKLVTLKLDDNMLNVLPVTIGRMNNLRYLTVSQNQITFIPFSLTKCRLDYLDLSQNKFNINELQIDSITDIPPWEFCSLTDLAAKVVLKKKIFYAPNIIPWTLVELLDNACNICICGLPVVKGKLYLNTKLILTEYFNVVVISNSLSNEKDVIVQCYFCSQKCYNRFTSRVRLR